MASLAMHPDILAMARGLKVSGNVDPVAGIVQYCLDRVTRWKTEEGALSIEALESLVTRRLCMVIHEIWTDEELARLQEEYLGKGEAVIGMTLEDELSGVNFATLFERAAGVTAASHDRYVAFVDCRSEEKAQRRFFTRWHEIAHVLTLYKQLELPLHRSYRMDNNEAEERLMDQIASQVGFYPPLFDPVANQVTDQGTVFTFDSVSRVIEAYASEASFDATFNALLRIAERPVLKLKVEMAYKAAEKRAIAQGGFLLPEAAPSPKLRVTEVISNQKAIDQKFRIHRNMQVPKDSIIFSSHEARIDTGRTEEDMSWWSSSKGGALPNRTMSVETRYIGDRLYALVVGR